MYYIKFVCKMNAFTLIIYNVKIECTSKLICVNAFIPNPAQNIN